MVKNMSYDIRIGVKVEGADCFAVVAEPEYASPTYNLRDMFVACMDWDYNQGEWYRCTEALPKLERGLHELTFNRKKYTQFNPSNGWGSTDRTAKTKCIELIDLSLAPTVIEASDSNALNALDALEVDDGR